jgi:hypothetical protein
MRTLRLSIAATAASLSVVASGIAAQAASPDQTSIVSENPANKTPQVLNGHVNALLQVGDTVYVGGVFDSVQEHDSDVVIAKNDIFAYSASTGDIDPDFNPVLTGGGVDDFVLAPDGTSMWVAGFFNKIDGLGHTKKIARITLDTGAVVTSFESPLPDDRVSDLNYANGVLYIGGYFLNFDGVPQELLAALDPNTGANLGTVHFDFANTWNGGDLGIRGMDVTADGTKMIVVGNFRNVDAQSRVQVAMFDLNGGGTATLSSWQTSRFTNPCSANFDTEMRDVAFSPNSSYFVIVTTGAFSGGANAATLCDTTSRWEAAATGSNQQPTWIDYSGGDTMTRIAITTAAVYIGGHFRWSNNPYNGDSAGPGAVARTGLAALDPRNGMPYTWNPTRQRGYGVYEFTVTNDGLLMGHDTKRVHNELHNRLAFFPLAGGATLPAETLGTLPGDAYLLGVQNGNTVSKKAFTGTSVTSSSSVGAGGVSWGTSRASWVIDHVLYTGWSNGTLTARPFNGGSFGAATTVGLNGLSAFATELSSMTSAFYDKATGRLYFTLSGQSSLFCRYFEPQSQILGGQRFTAQASTTDVSWSTVGGAFLVGGTLYFSNSGTGTLAKIQWANNATVTGTKSTVSGPGVDGNDWRARGLVLVNG